MRGRGRGGTVTLGVAAPFKGSLQKNKGAREEARGQFEGWAECQRTTSPPAVLRYGQRYSRLSFRLGARKRPSHHVCRVPDLPQSHSGGLHRRATAGDQTRTLNARPTPFHPRSPSRLIYESLAPGWKTIECAPAGCSAATLTLIQLGGTENPGGYWCP